jgi:RNA polymerase sigma factor (sigma-70 family)
VAWDTRAERLLREVAPQVLGAVIRRYRDFAASEDAVQEALLAAASQWPHEGIPDNPRGWLIQVASRRMTDYLRSETARRRREQAAAAEADTVAPEPEPPAFDGLAAVLGATGSGQRDADDTLVLIFMCCHPALTTSSAIALTLRAVGGLTTAEIASAFLVPESTMGQRISRAKQTIKTSGVPFRLPFADERAERLTAVLHVLYLIFNEGYTSSGGPELLRADLSREAIRLTRAVRRLLPDDAEAAGLLALMLLTDARRAARTGPHGELIPLAAQDRTTWDREAIAEGVALVTATLPRGAIGPYQLQAAIAAIHDEAPTVGDTDWPQIVALYTVLKRISNNPMVALNHAIATAMVEGPAAGLTLVDAVASEGSLKEHHRLDAVRAHLLEMSGDRQSALVHYRRAAQHSASIPERNYLLAQAARLNDSTAD